jgi:hypothetical protein
MFLSGKEIIFFILAFVLLFLTSKGALYMGPKLKLTNTISLIITSFLAALLLVLVYKYGKIANCQHDGFNFQVSGPKMCQGGPYMISSAPQDVKDYCHKLWSTQKGRDSYNAVNCGSSFVGRPVHFDRTPMSNDMWENEMCNPPYVNMNDPCVL